MNLRLCVWALAFLGLGWIPVRAQESASTDPLHTEGPWIKDRQGRVVILHGANASNGSKFPPFEPALAAREEDLWARLGWNVVRLLVIWEAIEPEPGKFDADYLRRLERYVDRFHAAGVRVVLDMHQDLYSRHIFGGDGAPAWAVLELPYKPRSPWFLNYFAPAVRQNFDRFWHSEELQEHYARAWEEVVRHFRGHPAVIGYDLMNEPYPGTAQPGAFEDGIFAPWTKRLAERLQALAPELLVFFEPLVTNATQVERFREVAGRNRVFAPHYYDTAVELTQAYDATNPAAARPARTAVGRMVRGAEGIGVPVLLGEWGVMQGGRGVQDYVRMMSDLLDQVRVGWCWWSWDRGDGKGLDFLERDGTPSACARTIVRAYPQRVAGVPEEWRSDPVAGTFTLAWRGDAAIAAPTEVVLPQSCFGAEGPRVVEQAGVARTEWDGARHVLRAWAAAGAERCTLRLERAGAAGAAGTGPGAPPGTGR